MNKKIIIIVLILILISLVIFYLIKKNPPMNCPADNELNISQGFKWINCMPPVNSQNKYCQSGYPKWIKDNCPGIDFTY